MSAETSQKKPRPVRAQAALTLAAVLQQQASLASLMAPAAERVDDKEQPLLQELCFGTCRWQPQLQSILNRLLEKPLKAKDSDIHALLLLGLYQLKYLRVPDHAAINTTVAACKALKKPWAEKLVNGVLRRYQREREALEDALKKSPAFTTAHPNWLRKHIENFWPEQAADIFAANNAHPPFTLRLNLAQHDRPSYQQKLKTIGQDSRLTPFSPFGITLNSACDVNKLPGFQHGQLSVQDEAAQLAAGLLQLQPGQRVLDACCAPGGKTGHILELGSQLSSPLREVVALDLEARRLERVKDNLQRLQQTATIICSDALAVDDWWDGDTFDRILLDAPCSATGVIRRHPDIKLLRNAEDIAKLAALQLKILRAIWPTLKPGGRLVYATCSLLPTENTRVIEQFIAAQPDAEHDVIDAPWGIAQTCGRQLLPQLEGHDGFYYACLHKTRR
ncbi:16S rRNA (cytosine(967)-C(5))-methyltransferase RsmB [Aestuariicella hydrocarbonica]|uniref:16S rRNA (cytosine(967)-C(5))-methyltransferase n=1 Tax=Pseudomaricurvus hydrocarbonicus TaxID=1470433 RepID=A0A9E5T4E7_9GAMM|nr:16S rRNA (cytosine(967)-C(5))-methyltransferase RsmB [Aestuariicella hydrocarbonica]NHO67937.1 16S rRNA (cytosine(967)-C(5))-methyltransferase RsmB [Aestuariicella hydrocarbonica]